MHTSAPMIDSMSCSLCQSPSAVFQQDLENLLENTCNRRKRSGIVGFRCLSPADHLPTGSPALFQSGLKWSKNSRNSTTWGSVASAEFKMTTHGEHIHITSAQRIVIYCNGLAMDLRSTVEDPTNGGPTNQGY